MPTKRFMLFQLILSGISQILIISPVEDVVSTKIALIKNSDSILVLLPACGHGTDRWQQRARGRAIAAAPAWPHPLLMSCMHTGLFIQNTEEVMSPSGTTRQLVWGSPRLSRQGRGVWLGDQASILLTVGLSPLAKWGNWCGCRGHITGCLKKCHCHSTFWTGLEDLQQLCMGLASRDKLKILWQLRKWWRSRSQSF